MGACDRLASRPLPADMPLLSLALVRRGLKFELNSDRADAVAEHFRAGGSLHMPGAGGVERIFVMR
eukprot:5272546-Pyramimonas_sp.AAC.1